VNVKAGIERLARYNAFSSLPLEAEAEEKRN
jgi:hypothetical protein